MTLTLLQESLLRRIENGELKFTPESENMTTEQFQTVAQALFEMAENGYKLLSRIYKENTRKNQSFLPQQTNFQNKLHGQMPGKMIRISQAARLLNCSKESIRTGKVGGFQTFKMNDKQKSPLFVYEADVWAFIDKRRDEKR